MKKSLLLVTACLLLSKIGVSQDAVKNVRFGIRTTPSINWMTPDNDKKIQKGGAMMKAGIGLALEFKLSDVASFQTGVDYTGGGFKAKYGTDTAYYLYKDDAIVEATVKGDSINSPTATSFLTSGGSYHRLASRTYNIGYLNIPLTFKLKTKDIGGMTYFGQIGANLMIRMKARANDDVYVSKLVSGVYKAETSITEFDKVDIAKTVGLITGAANVGGGAEYNISGSTSLYASVHYQHYFISSTKSDSGYLIRSKTESNTTKVSEFPNVMRMRQIVLAIGILF